VPLFHLFGFYDNELELLHSSSDVIDLESRNGSRGAPRVNRAPHNDTGTAEG